MNTCADLREHLIDLAYGELDADLHATVATHLEGCDACAAEVASFAAVRDTVGGFEIEPTVAETATLMAAIDAELEASQAPLLRDERLSGTGLRGTWDRAVYQYETSTRFRRLTLASIGLHAAAAAGVAWLLVGGAQVRRDVQVAFQPSDDSLTLVEDAKKDLEDRTGESTRVTPDDETAGAPRAFVEATRDGVLLPPSISEPGSLRSRGERLRAPDPAGYERISQR